MLTIEKKITLCFVSLLLTLIIASITSVVKVDNLTHLSRKIQTIYEPSIQANLRMTNAINLSMLNIQDTLLFNHAQHIRQRQATWSIIHKMHSQLMNYATRWHNDEHQAQLHLIVPLLTELKAQQLAIEQLSKNNNSVAAIKLMQDQVIPLKDNILTILRKILDPQKWEMARIFKQEEKSEKNLQHITLGFMLLAIFGSIVVTIVLVQTIITPLKNTVTLANDVAKGNYNVDHTLFNQNEALDSALKTMAIQLQDTALKNQQQQQRLMLLNDSLERSNEELSHFSYRTSHDLKAPLVTIRGCASAIIEDLNDHYYDEAKSTAAQIEKQIRKLETLIDNILDLSKAELQEFTHDTINLASLFTDIKADLDNVYLDKQVDILSDIDEHIRFDAPKVRIEQIITNLISNGIKYANKNQKNSYVKLTITQEENNIRFMIEDNGLGIPVKFQDSVFLMFKRFHPHTSSGSGLGMYIVKKHVEKLNGTITFESSSKGTIFKVLIPKL
ncbi:sensor histidine kinase [Pseudoalteromonas aurantia]|uniref:histidine kinase n=1 Tax=Pseudoalteromonas aurantia 208 TaxID=1314867 RepID=A0ABR9EG31_9GAMM|nr:HAMP domain-containing sensor histidine kinase [Pseudoalteromonas aurantia]MBE0369931.1 hypothetical protein [Pseudoalteromonas aurantia 208]